MLEELKKEVRNRIGLGDTLGAVEVLFSNEKLYGIVESDNILISKGEYMRHKSSYDNGLMTLAEYTVHTNKFHKRLLSILSKLNIESNSTNTGNPPNGSRVVKFDRKEIMLVVYENEKPIDLIFNTSYVKNSLYVKGESEKVHQKHSVINILKYSKRFLFTISENDYDIKYRLDVNFSYFSGLIRKYMLIRNDVIIFEDQL